MKYLLDTDVIVNHLRKKEKIEKNIITGGSAISIITLGELYYGAYKSINRENNLQSVKEFLEDFHIELINLSQNIMNEYAKLKSFLEIEGNRLDEFDLLIASTAIVHSLILVTHNLRHFKRILNLQIYKQLV